MDTLLPYLGIAHKREYLSDHPVSEIIGQSVRPIIKAYFDQADDMTDQPQGTRLYITPKFLGPTQEN